MRKVLLAYLVIIVLAFGIAAGIHRWWPVLLITLPAAVFSGRGSRATASMVHRVVAAMALLALYALGMILMVFVVRPL